MIATGFGAAAPPRAARRATDERRRRRRGPSAFDEPGDVLDVPSFLRDDESALPRSIPGSPRQAGAAHGCPCQAQPSPTRPVLWIRRGDAVS